MAKKYQNLRDKMSPDARARVDARVKQAIAEMPLHQLRRAREFTQATLAETMGTSQGEVSKIEQRTDCYISTLRSYVEAMHGELEIIARFPDGQTVKINQFSELRTGTDG
ncbi:MAG: transcriptional regulator [Acidobacteria bacterium RIFCSPLOWO2_02_FULL_68_18]|nr:MAG: transcriptional regulator [Acidobacteria bacterium RIFCSPLOWO2_02_FULL_68_18]OFW47907.1 MAG: transcriptional regulator [Acidobacteria bacterium RIFCSPLOWO2_12_FULL_68_19]